MLRRTVRLTKLPQGKQGIADHIRPGLFVDLNADALHFQADRRARVKQRDRKDSVLFPKVGSGQPPASERKHPLLPDCTGFFAQGPDMIVKCADGYSVFYAPLAVSKTAGSALGDQLQPMVLL